MGQLIQTAFFALIAVILVEVILMASWNKLYFTKAIPVLRRKIEITDPEKAEKRINSFITRMDNTDGFEKYKGIKASEGLFFYRHKLITFGSKNSAGIHGTISIDSENRCVIIKWNLDYSLLALLICFIYFISVGVKSAGIEMLLPFLFISIIYAISFAFNRSKFNKLVTEVKYLINRRY